MKLRSAKNFTHLFVGGGLIPADLERMNSLFKRLEFSFERTTEKHGEECYCKYRHLLTIRLVSRLTNKELDVLVLGLPGNRIYRDIDCLYLKSSDMKFSISLYEGRYFENIVYSQERKQQYLTMLKSKISLKGQST